jgi:hypothetical protein
MARLRRVVGWDSALMVIRAGTKRRWCVSSESTDLSRSRRLVGQLQRAPSHPYISRPAVATERLSLTGKSYAGKNRQNGRAHHERKRRREGADEKSSDTDSAAPNRAVSKAGRSKKDDRRVPVAEVTVQSGSAMAFPNIGGSADHPFSSHPAASR